MSALELRDVQRVHGTGKTRVNALNGISLTFVPGEPVAIMGPSGSGKQTSLNLADGLDSPAGGEVLVDATSLRSSSRKPQPSPRRRPSTRATRTSGPNQTSPR
ncbi:ATP-binding cassette domain-containing protein [Lentzea sp. NBRC 102530]|uniref:ATP-binding cassette domain-containing protein n=1 Tax=Lentzea sp. NBRC 102530 TaxID=3032201 RepID=UPI0024A1C106|nr:ATP-binding cassette domain-containing protein [Lentzea sp. NBRC 102530]GLY51600.1 hypothetical protein Lesp01_52560 [Lentzea sp. NBRC 102530]